MPRNAEYIPTPSEQAAINYHRRHLEGGTYKRNPDGTLTTFYGSIVGPDNGKFRIIPTYWGGDVRSIDDAMRFAMRSGIDFPTYPTLEAAEAAERRLHDIIEQDTIEFEKRKKKR